MSEADTSRTVQPGAPKPPVQTDAAASTRSPSQDPIQDLTENPSSPSPPTLLPRPRLLRRIRQDLSQGPVLIVAPPGYGKSVLLRDLIVESPGAHLIPLRPSIMDLVEIQRRLVAIPNDATILLDDIHYLDGEAEATAWLASTVGRADRHWILAGRTIPARLSDGWDSYSLLNAQDLALSPAESEHLLQLGTGSLSQAARKEWYVRTQGWPLALALAHRMHPDPTLLSLPEKSALPENLKQRSLSPPVAPILHLLQGLLAELPEDTRDMLLLSSLPERFNHALCAHLAGISFAQSSRLLTEVIRRNFFIQADEEPGWYRYHDLIRECLNHLSEEHLGRDQMSGFLRLAAHWFSAAHALHSAIDHALLAGDSGLAAHFMAQLPPSYIWDRGIFRTFERWVTALDPATQAASPSFLILLGRARLDIGDRAGARRWLNRAIRLAQDANAQSLVWETQTALAKLYNMEGEVHKTLELCTEVMKQAPEDHPAHLQALNAAGNAYTQLNRFRAARACYVRALEIATATNTTEEVAHARLIASLHHNLVMGIHIPMGEYEEALVHLRINDAYYADRPVARSMHLLAWCAFHEAIGDWPGLARNLAEIEAAEARSEHPDEENIWYYWYKALYHIGLGEYTLAGTILEELRPMMVSGEDYLCLAYAQAWRLRRMGYVDTNSAPAHWQAALDVSRETLATDHIGPLYRGMLALEAMLIHTALYGEHTPHTDPYKDHGSAATAEHTAIDGLLHTRARPWLLRLQAHLSSINNQNLYPQTGSRAHRYGKRVRHATEQMFFWRLLTQREPELGLRFWLHCLAQTPSDLASSAHNRSRASAIDATPDVEMDATIDANDQTVGDTTVGDTTVGDTTVGDTTVGDTVERARDAIKEVADAANGVSLPYIIGQVQSLFAHESAQVRARVARLLADLRHEIALPPLIAQLAREQDPLAQPALERAIQALESAQPPLLEISLLGEFAVTRAGRTLAAEDWHRPAVRRLFQYFALHIGQVLSRDRILDDLWPDQAPQAARNTFRTLFSWMRRALDPYLRPKMPARYFRVSGEVYCFAPEPVRAQIRLDSLAFESLVQLALAQAEADDLPQLSDDLLLALEEWAPLLPELPFEPWVISARERMANLYVEGCLHVAQTLLHLQRAPEAARWARRAIEVAPWLEEAYQSLMRAQARQGQRSPALRTYAEAVDALQRELDIAPSALTEWLAQRLRQGEDI